jgi:hypothetical protein
MPPSGVAFVRSARHPQHAPVDERRIGGVKTLCRRAAEERVMCIERILRNASFALATAAIILGVGYTIEVLPMVSALAR